MVHGRKHENLALNGRGGVVVGDGWAGWGVGDLVYTAPLMDALPLHV